MPGSKKTDYLKSFRMVLSFAFSAKVFLLREIFLAEDAKLKPQWARRNKLKVNNYSKVYKSGMRQLLCTLIFWPG